MLDSVLMNTNHHIAMLLAAERQRELRAKSGRWRLAELFGRRNVAVDAVANAESTAPPAVSPPAAPGGAEDPARRRPEPRTGPHPGNSPDALSRPGASPGGRRAHT